MNERVLLVDFENVQTLDLSKLADDFSITIFVGNTQKNIPFELVIGMQRFGERLSWIKIDGNGRNALDFHIAYYLGRMAEKSPTSVFFVLSKDKGFDPLVRYMTAVGLSCRRINSLMELDAARPGPVTDDPNLKRVVDLLSRIEKKSRPRRRKTLNQSVSALFQKKLPDEELTRLVDMLFVNGFVTESGGALSYGDS
jgi:hypothetical protein